MATGLQQQPTGWQRTKQRLKDSSWVTISWDWFQTFLTKAVDAVLWVTMIFACYQLIPGAIQPPEQVSVVVFICQFIALDVGGIGLNKLAMEQGLDRWSYPRVIAYILIAITLITVTFAGIEHAVPNTPKDVIVGIEVVLVVARSVMIVLYGIAIHHLKDDVRNVHEELDTLRQEREDEREEASTIREQMSGQQQEVQSLLRRLQEIQTQRDTLQKQWNTGQQEITRLREQLELVQQERESGQGDNATLQRRLNEALVEVDSLTTQLDGKKRELAGLREILEGSQDFQESRVRQMLETEQQRATRLSAQLDTELEEGVSLRKQLSALQAEANGLRFQLEQTTSALRKAEKRVQDQATQLDEKGRECERLKTQKEELIVKLRQAKTVKAVCENELSQTAKARSERVKGVKAGSENADEKDDLSQGAKGPNITMIDEVRVKVKASDEEVLAYMAAYPDKRVAEVAAHFEVTPRTIYNVLKRQQDGESDVAVQS